MLEWIFYNMYLTFWILDFAYWCFLGLVWYVCIMLPMVLWRFLFEWYDRKFKV